MILVVIIAILYSKHILKLLSKLYLIIYTNVDDLKSDGLNPHEIVELLEKSNKISRISLETTLSSVMFEDSSVLLQNGEMYDSKLGEDVLLFTYILQEPVRHYFVKNVSCLKGVPVQVIDKGLDFPILKIEKYAYNVGVNPTIII